MMWETFWPTAFGAALGVVAGVCLQYAFQFLTSASANKRIRSAIAKECRFNLGIVTVIEDALRNYRNAINGDTPELAIAHLPCYRGLHIQVTNLANTGRVYEFFADDELRRIQNVNAFLSGHNGTWFDSQLDDRKQRLILGEPIKSEVIAFLNFADNRVAELKTDLKDLLTKFDK